MRYTRTLLLLLASVISASCAATGQLSVPQWLPETDLREQAELAGGSEGLLYLRREIQGSVEVRQNPERARSQLTFRHVVTRRGDEDAGGPVTLRLLLPRDAEDPVYLSRVLDRESGVRLLTQEPVTLVPTALSAPIDPSQRYYEISFDDLRTGEILEVVTASLVKGPLVSDAQWLAAADAPTRELIVRYDLPPTARGALVVHGHKARPMVAQREAGEVLALRIRGLQPQADEGGHYRYTTRSADPRGYKQRYSRSWTDVSHEANSALVEMSQKVRG
ncbi:MAG: hypothetical protein VX938_13185, partial [Myxococcota bacterium]|nr:hypothetical protein [Myxococcota bacterium]